MNDPTAKATPTGRDSRTGRGCDFAGQSLAARYQPHSVAAAAGAEQLHLARVAWCDPGRDGLGGHPLGAAVSSAVRPPYRPEPGRGRGRPPLIAAAPDAEPVPPLPALDPLPRRFPPIDYSALTAAIAQADQVIRDTRRSLAVLARGRLPAPPLQDATRADAALDGHADALTGEHPADDR
jgi:hypothetical protein